MSLEGRLEMVAAKLSSRHKLPVEGSEHGFGGWGLGRLKGTATGFKRLFWWYLRDVWGMCVAGSSQALM